jgi:hypothetical protein
MTDETLIDRVADYFVGDQDVDSNVIEKPEAAVHQETYAQMAKSSAKTCKSKARRTREQLAELTSSRGS